MLVASLLLTEARTAWTTHLHNPRPHPLHSAEISSSTTASTTALSQLALTMDFGVFTASLTDRELGRLLSEIRLVIQETQQASVMMPEVPHLDINGWINDVRLIMEEQARRQRDSDEQSRRRRAAPGGA